MRKFIVFLCLYSLLITKQGISQAGLITADKSYAYELYDAQVYDLALKELLRVHFEDRDSKEITVLKDVAFCFEKVGDLSNAIKYLNQYLRVTNLDLEEKIEASYYKVQLLMKVDLKLALADLYQFSSKLIAADKDRYQYYLAMVYYASNEVELAFSELESLSYIDGLSKVDIKELEQKVQANADKKHFGARALSMILPGLGQTVSGDYKDGLNSAIINGSMIALFFYVSTNLSFADALLSIVPWFGRFYIGGMQNAKTASKRKQERKKQEYLIQLNQMLMDAKLSVK